MLPSSGDVKQQALDKLGSSPRLRSLRYRMPSGGRFSRAAKTAFAEPTANDKLQEASKSVQSWINAVERDFARFVHCDYEGKTNSLVCDKALAISGAEISSIDVRGLPTNKTVTVTASAARETVVFSDEGAPEWD